MVDNLAPDVQTQINTNFMEERIVDSQIAYPSSNIELSQRVQLEMADSNWMAKEQLMKPVLLGQVEWTIAQARDTSLYTASFPAVLEDVESLVIRTLRMYAFYKMAPCFRVQINSTQFHQGQLICSFDPFSIMSEYDPANFANYDVLSYLSATGLPNVKIMASESDAVELTLPFIHPRSFLTTNATEIFNNLGTFNIRVMNPLLAATGASPSLTVSIWLYAKDADVHVPVQDHTPILEATSKIPRGNQNNLQTKQIANLQQPSFMQSITAGIGNATGLVGNLVSGNVGQALRKGQGLIDNIGAIFGFDYPSITISPSKTITPVENLAVAIGQSQSKRMAIDPFSMHVLHDDIASESLQSMDLLTIARTPMFMSSFLIDSVNTPGEILAVYPITPVLQATFNSGTTEDTQNFQSTYLSHVSNAFVYWKGGIVYDFEVVATRFHSAKILIAYAPNVGPETEITFQEALSSLPNAILDIQQTSKLSIVVPFTSSTPMKNTRFIEDDVTTFTEATNGTMFVYLVNTLACASNVATTVELNVYISAADDFSLYVPRKFPLAPPVSIAAIEATSGIGLVHQKNHIDEPTTAVLSKNNPRSKTSLKFGEDYTLRDIIKRFSYEGTDTIDGGITSHLLTPFVPSEGMSFLSYWSFIYSAWTGSLRYKYITGAPRTSDSIFDCAHFPDYVDTLSITDLSDSNGYANIKTTLAQDNSLEVEYPYYSKYNMLLTRTSLPAILPEDLVLTNGIAVIFERSTTPSSFHQYIAAGDDFRFIYLRPPPLTSSGIGAARQLE